MVLKRGPNLVVPIEVAVGRHTGEDPTPDVTGKG